MHCAKRTFIVLLFLIAGIAYLPSQALETGPAGVYDEDQQGNRTALGYIYDQSQMTCAHKFHPSGTILQITRIDNGLSAVVQVTDRLSARANQVVILSTAAARALNMTPDRISIVQIEIIRAAETPQVYYNTSPRTVRSYSELTAKSAPLPESYDAPAPARPTTTIADRAPKLSLPSALTPSPSTAPQNYENLNRSPSLTAKGATATAGAVPRSYEATTPRTGAIPRAYDAAPTPPGPRYYVQTAAFADYDNAQRYYQDLLRRGITDVNIVQAQKADGSVIYRSRIGPYANAAVAKTQKEYLAREFRVTGLVVKGN